MLVSGLLSAPFAFYSPLFVPEYWRPERLMVLVTGCEDLVFSFANGVIVFGLGAGALPPAKVWIEKLRPRPLRFVIPCLLVFPAMIGLKAVGLGTMAATLICISLVCLFCLINQRLKTINLSLVAGAGFGLLYLLVLRLSLSIFPEMNTWWASNGLAGIWGWGVPLGEILWAVMFGATWPLFMVWTLDWGPVPTKDTSV